MMTLADAWPPCAAMVDATRAGKAFPTLIFGPNSSQNAGIGRSEINPPNELLLFMIVVRILVFVGIKLSRKPIRVGNPGPVTRRLQEIYLEMALS